MDPILGARKHFAPFLSCNHQWLVVCLWTFGLQEAGGETIAGTSHREGGNGRGALLAASPGSFERQLS